MLDFLSVLSSCLDSKRAHVPPRPSRRTPPLAAIGWEANRFPVRIQHGKADCHRDDERLSTGRFLRLPALSALRSCRKQGARVWRRQQGFRELFMCISRWSGRRSRKALPDPAHNDNGEADQAPCEKRGGDNRDQGELPEVAPETANFAIPFGLEFVACLLKAALVSL